MGTRRVNGAPAGLFAEGIGHTARMYSKLLGVLLWAGLAGGTMAEPILKPLFNGKDLSGWKVPAGNDAAGW